uniref:NADH-ubiquinone oxidoreductase chain 4 n=2 Tax=Pterocladia TaxID=28859 RepID=A0A1D8X7R1_9FLOR|nr:NADH dehydrogenase subunit 4 [Pterocladia mexicana]YP_009317663.1 NADH dehydrogenase subunit 4 [Pterocladia robusta]AOX49069.1 NADH dehydrogenase subunit 4 [Pterocladia mexicana]AOX49115.1 NADH dehydrogenase subunit 4 [Pterocladia robusta]
MSETFFNPLIYTALTPLVGALSLYLIPTTSIYLCRLIALCFSCLSFLFSLLIWIQFDSGTSLFQFIYTFNWLERWNLYYTIGVDGISIFFILLTTFLTIICVLISWTSITFLVKEYLICFLILEFCLIQVFSVLDLLLFYIFFESVLIPMFLIVGIWGSRSRKIRAAYQFFLYTLVGSLLMLLGLIFIYFQTGTLDIQLLWQVNFSEFRQLVLWLSFFASFAIKIPMIPFHIWLPEAHAEAPTAGSVILAGILLKMGGFGFLRFSLPLFPFASTFFTPLVFSLSLIAVIYASLTTLRQVDLKKIIAYSSVSHMGFVTIGIFSSTLQGIEGSIILMLSHGLVSSALFLCVGILYDRHKTRIIKYYSGLVQTMPVFGIFFLFFSFANLGFPGTSSFIGEFLVLFGTFKASIFVTFLASLGMIFGAAYSIWLFNRIIFGVIKIQYFQLFQDLSRREFWILLPLVLLVLWMGLYPSSFLDLIHFSVLNLMEQLC